MLARGQALRRCGAPAAAGVTEAFQCLGVVWSVPWQPAPGATKTYLLTRGCTIALS